MTVTTGTRLGSYDILDLLGAGGMGEVYRARDTRLQREVALKVLPDHVAWDPDRLARFEREAQTLAALNHPNVAGIYGIEESGGVRALVMELVEGEDLSQRIARGAMPLDDVLPIARQIAEGLEAAHDKGIVHRDLKPANVKVRPDGTVKILDFGLAKAYAGDATPGSSSDVSQSPTLTRAQASFGAGTQMGVILGTAAYMSPEQARGRGVDKRADIWAFGVVVWEMLTGTRLFPGDTVSDVLAAVLTRDPEWAALPPHVPRPVVELLRRTLAREPRQRLHDIADARVVLDEVIAGVSSDAAAASVAVGRKPRWTRLVLLSVGLALTVGAAYLGWTVLRGKPAPPPLRALSIVLPADLRLIEESFGSVSLSPDGSLAVVGAEDPLARRLYLRALASPEVRPLEGTEGGEGAFFSPDGRWIAFSQNGLKKLSLEGGTPVTIAPRIFGSGAWGADGNIYYTADYTAGLSRVAAAGGAPQALTKPDAARGELNHGYPDLLPGARALLFTSVRSPLGASRLEALTLETGARHVVVEHAIAGRYLQPGYLAFVRDETLMVAPFDLATLQLTGPPQPTRHRVAVSYGVAHADYALSSNGVLALVPHGVLPARREIVRLDRAGRSEMILPADTGYNGPALSPNGRQLALTRNDNGFDVVLYDLDRKAMTRLAATPRREYGPVWDQSGHRVFHVVDLPLFQIFETDTSGVGEPTRVLEGTQDQVPQDVSPDGRWLLYLQTTAVNRRSLGTLPLARPQEARLFGGEEGAASFASFSPDGRFVAFQSNETGREEVYLRPVEGRARSVPVSGAGGQSPRWAANGELFFWQRDQLMAVHIRTAPTLQIGSPQGLFRAARERPSYYDCDYDVTGDGQFVFLARTPDLLRPREIRVVTDWRSEVEALFAGAGAH